MCDYCGCRLQPAIEELSDEHERLLEFAYELRRLAALGSHDDVMAIVDGEFTSLLERHTDKEERGIFTQLRSTWEADARLDALVGEHRDMEAQVDELRTAGPGWQRAAAQLAADLAEHIMDEEVDLFPYAMYELGAAAWDAVAEIHAAAEEPLTARVVG